MSRITFLSCPHKAFSIELEWDSSKERVIRKDDLPKSSHIYLISSVRKQREVIVDVEGIKEPKTLESGT